MFDRIRITNSFSSAMGACLTKGTLILYLSTRKKDFIEGVVHELIEQTLHKVIGSFSSKIIFSNEYESTSIEHIITTYSYPYETIKYQFELLDKLFKPEKPIELWK